MHKESISPAAALSGSFGAENISRPTRSAGRLGTVHARRLVGGRCRGIHRTRTIHLLLLNDAHLGVAERSAL
jgi:hypothetical protein